MCAAETVGAGLSDMYNDVSRGLLGAVGIGLGAFAVGKVVTFFVINDIIGLIHSLCSVLGNAFTINGDLLIIEDDIDCIFIGFCRCFFFAFAVFVAVG